MYVHLSFILKKLQKLRGQSAQTRNMYILHAPIFFKIEYISIFSKTFHTFFLQRRNFYSAEICFHNIEIKIY